MLRPDTLLRPVVAACLAAALTSAGPAAAQAPEGLTGTLLVLNKQGDDANFVDLASGRIIATVPTGVGPHEVVISSDGATAVGTDYEGEVGSLTVFDIPGAAVVRTIDLAPYTRIHGIVFLPGDSLVAVTAERDGAVLIVRVDDGEITGVIPTEAAGSHMVAVTADGETFWTGDMGSNTVTELSRATGAKVRSLAAPDVPEAINVTPDGSRVFAGSNGTGRVTVFDTADGSSRTVAEGFGWPYRMFLTPGVGQLIVPDLRGEVLRFFDGATYEELGSIPFTGQAPQGLTLHGDGRHLFLSLSGAGRVAIVDIEARSVVGHLPAGSGPDGVGYSPLTVSR